MAVANDVVPAAAAAAAGLATASAWVPSLTEVVAVAEEEEEREEEEEAAKAEEASPSRASGTGLERVDMAVVGEVAKNLWGKYGRDDRDGWTLNGSNIRRAEAEGEREDEETRGMRNMFQDEDRGF
jgi:hypothetical protein